MAEITVYYEGPIVSKVDAVAAGLTHYFTGIPCKHGHIDQRFVSTGACRACVRSRNNTPRARAVAKLWRQSEGARESKRRRRKSDAAKATAREYQRRRRQTPEFQAALRGYRTKYYPLPKHKAYREAFQRSPAQKARSFAYRQRPEVKAAIRARQQTEEYKAAQLAYRQSEKGRSTLAARRASDAGRRTIRVGITRRRARERGASGEFTAEDEAKLRERQKKCHICGKRFTKADPATLDHVIALADGGTNGPGNIALAHNSCNIRKAARRTHLI